MPPIRARGMSRELVRRLLEARDEAKEALSGYLGFRESEALAEILVSKGAVGVRELKRSAVRSSTSPYIFV